MGDIYNYETNNINNTFSSSDPHHNRSSDDISLSLHQLLFRSRPSTMFSSYPHTVQPFSVPAPCDDPRRSGGILGVDSSDHGVLGAGSWSGNVRGASENETDHEHDCDCESEEGLEALMDEISAKPAPPRSSKRGRAAEVHNLSEKRRRRRINEKMKALQNLIPNSNKTDKASVLDEAIEYLKQLQLQVQMLSMRSGISLFPRCLPGLLQPLQLSPARMGFSEETESSQHRNMTSSVHLDEEARLQTFFGLPNQCTSSNQSSIPNASNIIYSKTSFGFESSIQAHFGPFPLCTPSEEICRKGLVPHQQLNVNHAERNLSEFELAAVDTTSLPFAIQACHLKDDSISLQACMIGRDQTEGEAYCSLLKNMEHNLILSQDLTANEQAKVPSLNHEIVMIEKPDI